MHICLFRLKIYVNLLNWCHCVSIRNLFCAFNLFLQFNHGLKRLPHINPIRNLLEEDIHSTITSFVKFPKDNIAPITNLLQSAKARLGQTHYKNETY